MEQIKNNIDTFYKQAFDKHLTALIESAIIDLANKRHLTPFLFSLNCNFPISYEALESCGKYKFGEEFILDRELIATQTLIIKDDTLAFLADMVCSQIIAESLNSLKFIEAVYINVRKQTLFTDIQMRAIETRFINAETAFWVNFEIDFFILAKLLISNSANYFITAFKRDFLSRGSNAAMPMYRLVNIPCAIVDNNSLIILNAKFDFNSILANIDMTNFATIDNPSIFELGFIPEASKIPVDSKIRLDFPWRLGNTWKSQSLYFFYPKKVMPVKDFSGLNAITMRLEDVINGYFDLCVFRSLSDLGLPNLNSKNMKAGVFKDSLADIRLVENNDGIEELLIESISQLPASRYLVTGFYDWEPLSPLMLINLIRYKFYDNSMAVDLRTKSFLSVFDFKAFIRGRLMLDAKQVMEPTVYQSGTTQGRFSVKILIPAFDLKRRLVQTIDNIRQSHLFHFSVFLNPYDLDRLVSEHGETAISMILDNPSEYVWCIEDI